MDHKIFQFEAGLRQEAEGHRTHIYRAAKSQAYGLHNSGAQTLRSGPYEEQRQYQDYACHHFAATGTKKFQRTAFNVLFQRVSSKK